MNYRYLLFILSINGILVAVQDNDIKNVLTTKLDTKVENTLVKKIKNTFHFDYSDTLLTDVLDEWAVVQNKNILFPQGAQAIKTKITYKLDEPLTLHQVEDLLVKILDMVGYTIKHQEDIIAIIKNDQQPERKSLDIYINIPLVKLPNTEQMIHYVYYLDNLSVKVSGANLKTILTDMLSKNAKIITDDKANALILTDKANNIQSAMKIIIELDQGGLRDAVEVIPVYYTSASLIENLFKKLLPQQKTGDKKKIISAHYFPKNTKVLALDRTNSLVIMGTTRSINIVKEFIVKYIDHPLESGRSVLHIYDLQYLSAETFAPILQKIVDPLAIATQAAGKAIGPKQYFQDVIIAFEKYKESKKLDPTQAKESGDTTPTAEGAKIGGNKLIIAARYEDWIRIKKLIKELDKPQLQVALEVLIIDLTAFRNRSLGSQLRNKNGFNNSTLESLNFQSAQLDGPVLKGTEGSRPPDALAANLLQLATGGTTNLASESAPGSLVLALQDNSMGVWNVWRLLNQYLHTTILSQPFLITKNKEKATVTVSETRFLTGDTESSTVSALTVNREDVEAGTTIDMLPTISKNGNINLLITVQINEFAIDANNRITRMVQTNANVGDGEILALGGLTKLTNNTSTRGVPVLSKIPLLGWFLKRKSKNIVKSNLLILIHPTIIQPYTPGGVNHFTAEKLNIARCDIDESLTLDNLRDPITRWFFQPEYTLSDETVGEYVRKTDELREYAKQKREKRSTHISLVSKEKNRTEQLQQLVKNEDNPLSPIKDIQNEVVFNT